MTVITKALGDKKADNLEEPLVDNIVVENNDEVKKTDLEAGGFPVPPPQATRYIISARVRPYYSLMFILMLVLLVTTSLLAIFGTEYLYEQYRYLVGSEQKPDFYRAWGTLSFNDDSGMVYESKVPARFEKSQENVETEGIFSDTQATFDILEDIAEIRKQRVLNEIIQHFESANDLTNDKDDTERKTEIKEEFELDLNQDRYEKIEVPSSRAGRFVHDFYKNYTAIVDEKNSRCFIMPLDRSVILPPKSLYDLLFKMQDGYYSIDTEKVRRDMQVVLPPVKDLNSYGIYIAKDCQDFTSYKLEKYVGGVVKRSVSEVEMYKFFVGHNIVEFAINNIPPNALIPEAMP